MTCSEVLVDLFTTTAFPLLIYIEILNTGDTGNPLKLY